MNNGGLSRSGSCPTPAALAAARPASLSCSRISCIVGGEAEPAVSAVGLRPLKGAKSQIWKHALWLPHRRKWVSGERTNG